MKTYTFWAGTTFPGIGVNEQQGRLYVLLGSRKERGRFMKLALDPRNPPEVVDGKVHSAAAIKPSGEEGRYLLAKAQESAEERRALVRIKTDSIAPDEKKKGEGKWTTQAGDPQFIETGQGADVHDGQVHTWDDGVVLMHPDDVIDVTLEDGARFSLNLHPTEGLKCTQIALRPGSDVIVPPFIGRQPTG